MDEMQAIRERHTVRKYLTEPIPADLRKEIDEKIGELNEKHGVHLATRYDDVSAFGPALRLVFARGVRNFLVLAAPGFEGAKEALGRAGAEFMIFCQQSGLNTWWVGGTFSRSKIAKMAGNDKLSGIIAFGYGTEQGKPHKSKKPSEVASYDGEEPEWFRRGVECALLAPTAMNKQAFHLSGKDGTVTYASEDGTFSKEDAGIVKVHFEIGAGRENFHWVDG
jgi:nitroreductase